MSGQGTVLGANVVQEPQSGTDFLRIDITGDRSIYADRDVEPPPDGAYIEWTDPGLFKRAMIRWTAEGRSVEYRRRGYEVASDRSVDGTPG